jgi:hypothetical protein
MSMTSLKNTQSTIQVATLLTLDRVSPRAASWLQNRDIEAEERGDISVQQVVWYAIGMAGAFAIAVIIYNALSAQATKKSKDLDNPVPLPGAPA